MLFSAGKSQAKHSHPLLGTLCTESDFLINIFPLFVHFASIFTGWALASQPEMLNEKHLLFF